MKAQNYIRKTSIGILFLLLALTAALIYFIQSHASGFTDVPQNHWAAATINEASADGVIKGIGNNKFDPNGNVTLAQFTAILTRMAYPSEVEASTVTGEWWAKNAEVARNHNFYEYLENTDMNHALTREEMAHIIYNAYPKAGDYCYTDATLDETLEKIPDAATLSNTYKYSVSFCYFKGILQGVDKAGNFSPKATLTRAQTAAIYVRYKNILAGNAPTETPATPEQPTETPAEPPATVDNRDLNEWGIPHFRMLEGENVQQMMDRINAVTPPYKEGYLTNGKPITDENIKEMIDAVVEDMPAGSEWNNTDNKYWYNNAAVWKRGSNGCNSYAYCVSDYIFGEDAPINIHKDFSSLKVGDAMWSRNGSTKDHWVVIKEVNFDAETPYEYSISGNVNGKVSDAGGDLLTPLLDNNNPFAQYSTIWSRY